jgi:hypothetical protein
LGPVFRRDLPRLKSLPELGQIFRRELSGLKPLPETFKLLWAGVSSLKTLGELVRLSLGRPVRALLLETGRRQRSGAVRGGVIALALAQRHAAGEGPSETDSENHK